MIRRLNDAIRRRKYAADACSQYCSMFESHCGTRTTSTSPLPTTW